MSRALAILIALTSWSCATAPPRGPAVEEAVIRALEEQERTAVLNRDSGTLEQIWAPEFIVNSPLGQISPNRAVVLDLVRRGLIHYTAFERRIEEFRIIGNTAVVMGGETVQAARAETRPVQRRFTHIWLRHADGWRLVARHANDIVAQ